MNYEANEIKWEPGDIVIHDADSKDHKMLMVILSVDDQGMAKSKYLNIEEIIPTCLIRKYGSFKRMPMRILNEYLENYDNDIKYLHDPNRFDIVITENDRDVAETFLKWKR